MQRHGRAQRRPHAGTVHPEVDEIVSNRGGATLAQLVINWTLGRDGVTAALVGARNPRQAEENARAADFTLTGDETARINELLDALELDA